MTMPVQAEVYKWTDADGVVRYGQLPPPGVQTQTIGAVNANAAAPEAPAAAAPVQDEAQLERIRAEQAAREDKRKAEAEEYCKQARAELQTLSERPSSSMARLGENGERVRMTQEEYDAHRAKVQAGVDEHCSQAN
ncbi:MAG: DUF4124 domain-containing protein [Nevskiales bacterium]